MWTKKKYKKEVKNRDGGWRVKVWSVREEEEKKMEQKNEGTESRKNKKINKKRKNNQKYSTKNKEQIIKDKGNAIYKGI